MPRQSYEVTRAAIQDAAIALFGAKTYKELTMDEVAKKSQVSKRTLYKYYPSKISLFASIFEQYLKMFLDDERTKSYTNLNYAETVKAMLNDIYEFTNTQQGFMRLFWMLNNESNETDIPEELLSHINHWNVRIVEHGAAILRSKRPEGFFKHFSPELTVHLFSAINKGIYLQITKETGLGIGGVTKEDLINMFSAMIMCCAQDEKPSDTQKFAHNSQKKQKK
jgi:TetR/AcrR family transcriptional regulator of autoinduction and epiphytic fitness